ncbi:MAG: glycosyltransferase family 4 protein [Sphingobacteriaceae bacterium]|nr:glycosyltransferase family 4 protein [Sphingobacteriaceae bacterium]
MKKIALITDGIWPYVMGGMQKHSYYLCKYFAKNQIHVDLFHFNQSELDINRLDVFSEEEKKYIHSTVLEFPNSASGFGHYIINSYRYSLNVYELIKDKLNDYDFIYSKGFTGWHFIREKRRGIKCPPIGVKFHGYEMFQRAPDFKSKVSQLLLLRKPVKEISQQADFVFSYGGKITDILKSIGVKSENILELPSGVEESIVANEITPTSQKIKFVYLGRYERRKGIEELNKALKSFNSPNFEFHFIGNIPTEKQLQLSFIKNHGEIRDKLKLNTLLKQCDVLVCPSWSEGMPNVILESMANGLTVLATNVGATNVLVNEKTGWLIEKCSVSGIKTAIQKINATPLSETDSKKKAALSLIREKFTWEKLITALIKKIEKS